MYTYCMYRYAHRNLCIYYTYIDCQLVSCINFVSPKCWKELRKKKILLYVLNKKSIRPVTVKSINFKRVNYWIQSFFKTPTVVCILPIVFIYSLCEKWLYSTIYVKWPSREEGSVSSGSSWPGAEQEKPSKMAADRQVQPTEPDKGTNNTQM